MRVHDRQTLGRRTERRLYLADRCARPKAIRSRDPPLFRSSNALVVIKHEIFLVDMRDEPHTCTVAGNPSDLQRIIRHRTW